LHLGRAFASLRLSPAGSGMATTTEATQAVDTGPDGLPRHTTPTWEVELLISGVAVFAMLQLPGWLDDAMFALRPRFGTAWADPLLVLYVYAKTAAVILASTFVLHLLLRARWIALVGLLSVHPRGIDWNKLRIGPIARELEQARFGGFPDAIERADNLSTIVFAVGVSLAWLMLWVTLLASVLMAVSVPLGGFDVANPLLVALAVVIAPFALAQLVDRRFGAHLSADSAGGRLLRRVLRTYQRFGFGLQRNLGMAVLTTNGDRVRVLGLTLLVMLLAFASVVLGYDAMRRPGRIGSFDLFPAVADAPDVAIDSAHYDDTRNPARDAPVPYLPSMIARDAYLRVVVPYVPTRDEPGLRRACPTLEALAGPRRARESLACLGRLHALSLDGGPLGATFDIGSDPRTNRPALVAMLAVHALPRGRHVLAIAHPADAGAGAGPNVDLIPFWR
jgi:hypothetical protein